MLFKVQLDSQYHINESTDRLADWAAYFLNGDHAAYSPYLYQIYNAVYTVKSWILPLIDQVSRKPDLATIALLLIIIFVSLKIVDMLWQTVMFWIRMVRRLVFWGGLAALALWVWSRGPEGMLEDVRYWSQTWNKEYDHWKDKETVAKMARQGGRGYGRPQQTGWF